MFDYEKLNKMVDTLKEERKDFQLGSYYEIKSNYLAKSPRSEDLENLKKLINKLYTGELRLLEAKEDHRTNTADILADGTELMSKMAAAEDGVIMDKIKDFIYKWDANHQNEDFFNVWEELLDVDLVALATQTGRIYALEQKVDKLEKSQNHMPINNSTFDNQAGWVDKINNLANRLASLEAEYASLADRLRSQSTADLGSASDFDKGIKDMENTLAEMNKVKEDSLDKHFEDVTFSNKSQIEQREQQKPQPSYKPYRPGIQDSQNITSQIKPAKIRPAMPSNRPNIVPPVEEPKQMPNNNYHPFPEQQSNGFNVPQNRLQDQEQILIAEYNAASNLIRFGKEAIRLGLNEKDAKIRADSKVPFISLAQSKEVPLIDVGRGSPMYYAFEDPREMNEFYVTPAQKIYATDNIKDIGMEEFFDIRGELRQSDLNRFSLDAPAIFKKVGDNFVIERRGVITV